MFDKTAYAVCLTLIVSSVTFGWSYWCFVNCGRPEEAATLIEISFAETALMVMTTLAASGYSEFVAED